MPTGTVMTKVALQADIDADIPAGGGGNVTNGTLNTILSNMLASYENVIIEQTTVQRNALTPFQGQKIFNTTNLRVEIYSDATGEWLPASQKTIVATDCSANPNYPEGGVGDLYYVSVSGKVGGASGKTVYVGDCYYCIEKNAGGTEASVGTSWVLFKAQTPKKYVALLTQAGTSAPTATVLENTTGTTISYTYDNVGIYTIDALAAVFTANKTTIKFGNEGNGSEMTIWVRAADTTTTQFIFEVYSGAVAANDMMQRTLVEITIYP